MPCNIGFKSYTSIAIPAPQPQTFTSRAEAPDIDGELLEKLGVEDPEFLAWAVDLDTKPLLREALKRACARGDDKGLLFEVNAEGILEAKGSFVSAREKKQLSDVAAAVSARWQFEILGIVTELLNYRTTVTVKGDELVLEAEELGKSHPCNYIKVTKKGEGATLTFEHFKSRNALSVETAKFLLLARRLGVKIVEGAGTVSKGDPFPDEVQHSHPHGHRHDDHEN